MHLEDDTSKITTATMYLSDDAALWWRRRQEDIKKGLVRIATRDEFKGELKKQFYPENAVEIAMRRLRGLRQTGTIRDYVSQYLPLMLEIPDMEESTRLIFFMDGLKDWAEQELRRRKVKTLAEAIAVAESLIEFEKEPRRDKGKRVEEDTLTSEKESHQTNHTAHGKDSAQSKWKSKGGGRNGGKSTKPFKCFLCDQEGHGARDCPRRHRCMVGHGVPVSAWGSGKARSTSW